MSQQQVPLLKHPITSAGVISKRRLVGFDKLQATVQGQKVLGVADMDASAAGKDLPVIVMGTAICEAGAAVAAGATLISDASGRVITNTGAIKIAAGGVAVTSVAANGATDITGSDLPEFVVGYALEAAAGAGSFIEVRLI